MPTFVKLSAEDRISLFADLKKRFRTWDDFFSEYKLSRAMFFHYKAGRFDIPEEWIAKWQDEVGYLPNILERTEKNRYTLKDVKSFKMDADLAEILGVLNGDGHISRKEISIVGNIHEIDYYNYLKNLFENKFGLFFKLILDERQNSFKIRTYSTILSQQLRQRYGLPAGNKMGNLKVPAAVRKNKELSESYLRGLFDTDGCFHVRRRKDPMISITSADPRYLAEVRGLMENLGFAVSKGDRRIFLYRKDEIDKFFNEVKPANSKHLKKYQSFQDLIKRG